MLHLTIVTLTSIEIIVAIILIALILAQKSKSGGGLGGLTGGGGGAEEVFGSQATSILTKATIYFGIFFLINTLGLAVLHRHNIMNQNISAVDQATEASKAVTTPGMTKPLPGDETSSEGATTPATDATATPATDKAAGDTSSAVPATDKAPAASTETSVEAPKAKTPAADAAKPADAPAK